MSKKSLLNPDKIKAKALRQYSKFLSAWLAGEDVFPLHIPGIGVPDDSLAVAQQQVQAFAPRVEAVNEGMQAQATGAEQISQALTQLSEAAQQTVESLRQSGLAIDQLNKVSSGLRNGISRFKLA